KPHARPPHDHQYTDQKHKTNIICDRYPECPKSSAVTIPIFASPEEQVCDTDHYPIDNERGHYQRHEDFECLIRHDFIDQNADGCECRRYQDRSYRYILLVESSEKFGCVALFGQSIQHAAIAVHAAVINR